MVILRTARTSIAASGHGQLNTDNAGEQYGTWKLSRAGFCPGSEVYPWINDVSRFYRPGEEILLDYDVEPYINDCRPGVIPCPCDNCEWDNDHTAPVIKMYSQFIHYRNGRTTPALEVRSPLITRVTTDSPSSRSCHVRRTYR